MKVNLLSYTPSLVSKHAESALWWFPIHSESLKWTWAKCRDSFTELRSVFSQLQAAHSSRQQGNTDLWWTVRAKRSPERKLQHTYNEVSYSVTHSWFAFFKDTWFRVNTFFLWTFSHLKKKPWNSELISFISTASTNSARLNCLKAERIRYF